MIETYPGYGRPIFTAETGIWGKRRAQWIGYVHAEVLGAMEAGVPVEAICLYPILDHLGWDDDRVCANGLLSGAPSADGRAAQAPLADALRDIA